MHEGRLVGGEGFAIDASVIKADANRARGVPATETAQWRDRTRVTRPCASTWPPSMRAEPVSAPPK